MIVAVSAGFGIPFDMFTVEREENSDNLICSKTTKIIM